MTSQPLEANVVLTADTDQYSASMSQAAAQTDQLGKSVDSLSSKLDRLAKSAGRKMLGIAAADVAGITAATAAYGAFEKQMTSLSAQAAVLNRNAGDSKRVFGEYVQSVNGLRKEFGTATAEAAQLIQAMNKLGDGTAPVNKLAETFVRLGSITGESSTALANSMLQLQKTMGTPQRETEKFANQLTVLQARSNTSSQAILDFAQSIAPVGRMVGMTQTDIMGFSNAFIKAGQDGYQASSVFNKMLSDIAYASQTGSPELAKYANLVGMTVENFRNLGGTDQFLKIFDSINRAGPEAITTLNRMGLDGMRTVRTVTAMAQQSGGIRSEIVAARGADQGALARGSEKAFDGLIDSLNKLRAELAMTAESFGSKFAGPMKAFVGVIETMASAVTSFMNSPAGTLTAWALGAVGGFAALGGAIAMSAKAMLAFSSASLLLRNSFTAGLKEGRVPGARALGEVSPVLARGEVGRQLFSYDEQGRTGSWLQRGLYNAGSRLGMQVGPAGPPGALSAALRIPETALGSRNMLLRAGSAGLGWAGTGLGWGMRNFIGGQYSAGSMYIPGMSSTGGFDDYRARWRIFNSPTARGSFGWMGAPLGLFRGMAEGMGYGTGGRMQRAVPTPGVGDARTFQSGLDAHARAMQLQQSVRAAQAAESMGRLERSAMTATRGLTQFGRGLGNITTMIASTGMAAGRMGGNFAMRAMNDLGISRTMMGVAAIGGTAWALNRAANERQANIVNMGGFANPYLERAGVTPISVASRQGVTPERMVSLSGAMKIDARDIAYATRSEYKPVDDTFKGLTEDEAFARLQAQWGYVKDSPEAVANIANDLISFQGGSSAQRIMGRLSNARGGELDASTFIRGASNAGYDWTGIVTGQRSGKKSSDSWNQFYGALEDQFNYLSMTEGEEAARKMYGQQLSKGISQFGKNAPGELEQAAQEQFLVNALGLKKEDIDFRDKGFEYFSGEASGDISPFGKSFDLQSMLKMQTSKSGIFGKNEKLLEDALAFAGQDVTLRGGDAADALFKYLMGDTEIARQGPSTRDMLQTYATGKGVKSPRELDAVQTALANEGDINAQYDAIRSITKEVKSSGMDVGEQMSFLAESMNRVGGDAAEGADLFRAARNEIQRSMAFQMPYMSRTEQFGAQTSAFKSAMLTRVGQGFTIEDQRAEVDRFQQGAMQQFDYFKQMLYQQREYEVMRGRAQEDYDLQRTYQEEDFYKGRARAEQDFALQRQRAQADFSRQQDRSQADFNLSRRRQEEDHQHQIVLMAEQAAKTMYNIYERTGVRRTSGSQYMLYNAQEQLTDMRQQSKGLDQLRAMGLSDDAIQQLDLTNPQNAQQLQRLLGDIQNDPTLIKKFNDMVRKRIKAAANLVTDESSAEWEEFNRQYKIARDRAQDDFEKAVRRSQRDFKRNMAEMETDFRRSMSRQADDYDTMMSRQADSYSKSMERAAEDLARSAKTIDGTFEDILTKATRQLSGHAKKQAQTVLKEFQDLKSSATPAAAELMSALAMIFGVEFKAPKGSDIRQRRDGTWITPSGAIAQASGGVLPGFTPGNDTIHYRAPNGPDLHLSGGEAIMRPEWVRAVGGPKAVYQMNREAKYGFADGGLIPQNRIDAAKNFARSQVGDPYTWGGVGPNGFDCSGFMSAITNVLLGRTPYSRVGATSSFPWGGFRPGPGQFTIGSTKQYPGSDVGHMAGTLDGMNVESRGGIGVIIGPAARGYKDSGFDTVYHLGESGDFGSGIGGTGMVGSVPPYKTVASKYYMTAEKAVSRMDALRPLGFGDISKMINGFGRDAYKTLKSGKPINWNGLGGIFTSAQQIGVGERFPEMVLPLNERGAEFLSTVMAKVDDAKGMNTAGFSSPINNTFNSYRIDRSTNFHGAITVMASDPNEMLKKLQAKQRQEALVKPRSMAV